MPTRPWKRVFKGRAVSAGAATNPLAANGGDMGAELTLVDSFFEP